MRRWLDPLAGLFTVSMIVACGFMVIKIFDTKPPPRQFEDRVFYTHFGGVYCGNARVTTCGMMLWNCSDERVYECLHEVAWKDVKP